jgi:L-2-hydroxycarboxylate dehydrogenase (NAD+)
LPGGEIGRLVLGTLDTESRCTKGDFFLLLNPGAFAGGPLLASRVASYLDELRHSPPQKGSQSVIVPGDRARQLREERLRSGIPLPKEVWLAAERLKDEF